MGILEIPLQSSLMASTSDFDSQIEWAWHLLTVLIRLGRPVLPAELAVRCPIAVAALPDVVEQLCRIPRSPLLLNDSGFVTVSETAITAFGEFVSSVISPFVPRSITWVWGPMRVRSDPPLFYVRKRRAVDLRGDLPASKRRLLLPMGRDLLERSRNDGMNYLDFPRRTSNLSKVQFEVSDCVAKVDCATDMTALHYSSCSLFKGSTSLPFLFNHVQPNVRSENIDHVSEERSCSNEETCAIVVHKQLPMQSNNSAHIFVCSERTNACEEIANCEMKIFTHDKRMSHFDTGLIKANDAVCLAQENRVSSTPLIFPGTENAHHAPSTVVSPPLSHEATPVENVGFDDIIFSNKGSPLDMSHLRIVPEEATGKASVLGSPVVSPVETATIRKQQSKTSDKLKVMGGQASTAGSKCSLGLLDNRTDGNSFKPLDAVRDCKNASVNQKSRRNCKSNLSPKEVQLNTANECKIDAGYKIPKALESKSLPEFESFVVEEEEGAGGYGTVYRARRKVDGRIFAIKCPHANAHLHHVNNELKMLERFGGRNFVIKFEGSFKSGDAECFVLEHVEHDRPELLKKDIDVSELQWYGYCMFRALASLHKQGIVHRDVKPGNFLFSRKLNKGYLIDFNLANDLQRKYFKGGRKEAMSKMNTGSVSLGSTKPTSFSLSRKSVYDGIVAQIDDSKNSLVSKNMKKKSRQGQAEKNDVKDLKNKYGSQAADASGVTSAKDLTSTKTSGDRLKQPIPNKGRKELINFVHEAMQVPNHKAESASITVSHRKRVSVPMGKVDRRGIMPTPMPLHPLEIGKLKREGPCVGTKGFRAPEVLFKSHHQGCKLDVWSAGVTLLYLVIGRAPFGGDPEQNIKEIAKLRGSEDLWEVAKLHDREFSFPTDLLNVQSLQSMNLKDWCLLNTRRTGFLELVPQSLFDLLNKCLTVNPRVRINAEEALMHEFFTPCHEILRKQRQLRKAAGSESNKPLRPLD